MDQSTRAPRPGRPVRGSRTGRPVMALLDLLGRRLTLRVLWELRDGDPVTFRTLQQRCGDASSSTLNRRLAELAQVGILEQEGGYRLSPRGRELVELLGGLQQWARRWGRDLSGGDDVAPQ